MSQYCVLVISFAIFVQKIILYCVTDLLSLILSSDAGSGACVFYPSTCVLPFPIYKGCFDSKMLQSSTNYEPFFSFLTFKNSRLNFSAAILED